MRTAILAAAAIFLVPAHSAKPLAWAKEPATIFGLRLGDKISPSEVLDCGGPAIAVDPPRFGFCKLNAKISGSMDVAGFSVSAFEAGHLAVEDGTATSLSIFSPHDRFDDIRSILVQRYGAPTLTSSFVVTTARGARFPAEKLVWRGKKLIITALERSGTADQSTVSFEYLPTVQRSIQQHEDAIRTDASKL